MGEKNNTWKSVALDEIRDYMETYRNMKLVDAMVPAKNICKTLSNIYDAVYKIREKGDGIQGCAACKHLMIESPAKDITLFGCDKGVKALTTSYLNECRFCENTLAKMREKEHEKKKEAIEKITNPKITKQDVLDLCNFKINYYLKNSYPNRVMAEEFVAFKEMVEDLPDYPHPYDATLATLKTMPVSIIHNKEVDKILDAIEIIEKHMAEDWVKEKLKGGEA